MSTGPAFKCHIEFQENLVLVVSYSDVTGGPDSNQVRYTSLHQHVRLIFQHAGIFSSLVFSQALANFPLVQFIFFSHF